MQSAFLLHSNSLCVMACLGWLARLLASLAAKTKCGAVKLGHVPSPSVLHRALKVITAVRIYLVGVDIPLSPGVDSSTSLLVTGQRNLVLSKATEYAQMNGDEKYLNDLIRSTNSIR